MQNLNITFVQADQKWEDKIANYRNYEQLLADLPSTDVVLLPEMFSTGFSMNTENLAEEMETSEAIAWLKKQAQKLEAAIYTSMIIKEGSAYFNRGLFVEADGKISIYDKRKTFGLAKENDFYQSGKKATIVNYRGWKLMLQICYDLRFPEIVRNGMDAQGKANYDVILYVANWPETRKVHWKTLLQARAIENQCFVAGLNRVGSDAKNLSYSGNSQLVDLLGNVQELPESKECIQTIELSAQLLNETREKLPFLKDAE